MALNKWQKGNLTSNTIQNLKNNSHCIFVTARSRKIITDPPILIGFDDMVKPGVIDVKKVSTFENYLVDENKLENPYLVATKKTVAKKGNTKEVSYILANIERPLPPLPQRLNKKPKEGKDNKFFFMLKQFS